MKKYTPFLVIIISMSQFYTQAQVTIGSELRPRAEIRHGYKNLPENNSEPAIFINQRTRLNMEISEKKYSLYLSLQDVRVWGDESQFSSTGVTGDNASIDLYNAYFIYNLTEKTQFKIGRQNFKYFDERLLAKRNWNQNGVAYDAFLFQNNFNNHKIDIGLSYNNAKENTFGNDYDTVKYKTFNFTAWDKSISEELNIAMLNIAAGKQKAGTKSTVYLKYTSGILINFKKDLYNLNASSYYQYGKNELGQKVKAYFYTIGGTLKLNNFSFSVNRDFLSGQDKNNTSPAYQNIDHRFDILYGARHKYYGFLDYFSNINKATANSGLSDLYFTIQFEKKEKHKIALIYHYFNTTENPIFIENNTNAVVLDNKLGSEIDLIYKLNLSKEFTVESGFSTMIPTETFKKLQNINKLDNFTYWFYTMICFSPSFTIKELKNDNL